jgi:LPXTG-site transpeptidase (sortase) family protein
LIEKVAQLVVPIAIVVLVGLTVLSSPLVMGAILSYGVEAPPTSIPTAAPTDTPMPTATMDPFKDIPVLNPGDELNEGGFVVVSDVQLGSGAAPTPLPTVDLAVIQDEVIIPTPPTPVAPPPNRIAIPRLGLDAPVEPAGMTESDIAPGVVEWSVPDHRAAGWLDTSAPFGTVGNMVIAGHHNINGEVFKGLWDLEAGDIISLWANDKQMDYAVADVLILPDKNQPLEVRLRNAQYIHPTEDERVTLVTCWPYENNTHRVVVIAFPLPALAATPTVSG